MRILVTGATGYVGGRLTPRLIEAGHDVHVLVRDRTKAQGRPWSRRVTIHEGDLLEADTLTKLPTFDAAYYLVHSMASPGDFSKSEAQAAQNFAANIHTRHCIYLGGLQPVSAAKEHLASRAEVGRLLAKKLAMTEFRAGPILGSGSASFEMVRYLSERLPLMVTPRWTRNQVHCIGIHDVLQYLQAALQAGPLGVVDLGGEALSFADMMQRYAVIRGLRHRLMIPTPLLAPGLAARWVGFITPIPNRLAVPIIDGARAPLLADLSASRRHFPHLQPMGFDEAIQRALQRTEEDLVEARWSGAGGPQTHQMGTRSSPANQAHASEASPSARYQLVDERNLKQETRTLDIAATDSAVFAVLASLGGTRGWLAWNWAWKARGALDRAIGGPGLRRGRRHRTLLAPGDALDFWRVEALDVPRLLRLRAEMKLPGRAWLEFNIEPLGPERCRLIQTAFFEPKGVPGILYWQALYPVHRWLFHDLIQAIAQEAMRESKAGASRHRDPGIQGRKGRKSG